MALDVWGELASHKRSLTHHPWFSRPEHPVSYSLAYIHVCVTCVQYLCEHASRMCGAGLACAAGVGTF